MINIFLNRYWSICLLKETPENIPYSIIKVFLSGIFFALIMVMEWNTSYFSSTDDLGSTLFISTGLIGSYVVYTYLLLSLKELASRLVQTLLALFCTSIIIHLLVVPLIFITPYLSQIHLKNPIVLLLGVIYLFLSIGLSVWQFVIIAHIYKHTLNISPIQSVLVSFGLIAVNILTVSLLQ